MDLYSGRIGESNKKQNRSNFLICIISEQQFSYENACFFLADNGDIYVYDEDEKLHFVQRIGKDDVDFHFTTHFGTKDDWWLFTTKGSYRFIYLPGR